MNKLKKLQVINYLLDKYPLNSQENWDRAGISYKNNSNANIKGVLTCIDVTKQVIEYCALNQINLVISHHPFIFAKSKKSDILANPYKQEIIKLVKEYKITLLSLHTNYDINKEGTSFQIAKLLNFRNIVSHNYWVSFELKDNINNILFTLKNVFKLENTRRNFDKDKYFENGILLSGSGDYNQIINLSKEYQDALFISSDFKWNEWVSFNQMNINVLEIPHLTEEAMGIDIKNQLESIFSIKVHFWKQDEIYFNN